MIDEMDGVRGILKAEADRLAALSGSYRVNVGDTITRCVVRDLEIRLSQTIAIASLLGIDLEEDND